VADEVRSFDLRITGTLPGETAIQAICEARKTVDPALLKRLDAVLVQMVEDVHGLWRKMWTDAGLLK
jgi:hypothetical protein